MTEVQKRELEMIVKSLTATLEDVEGQQGARINISNLRPEETKLIRDLLVNYLKKRK